MKRTKETNPPVQLSFVWRTSGAVIVTLLWITHLFLPTFFKPDGSLAEGWTVYYYAFWPLPGWFVVAPHFLLLAAVLFSIIRQWRAAAWAAGGMAITAIACPITSFFLPDGILLYLAFAIGFALAMGGLLIELRLNK